MLILSEFCHIWLEKHYKRNEVNPKVSRRNFGFTSHVQLLLFDIYSFILLHKAKAASTVSSMSA